MKEGWASSVDPGTGNTFYYHAGTGLTQWEMPIEDAPSPPPPPPPPPPRPRRPVSPAPTLSPTQAVQAAPEIPTEKRLILEMLDTEESYNESLKTVREVRAGIFWAHPHAPAPPPFPPSATLPKMTPLLCTIALGAELSSLFVRPTHPFAGRPQVFITPLRADGSALTPAEVSSIFNNWEVRPSLRVD